MKIYFAGPDVFRTGYAGFKEEVTLLCHSRVFVPIFPGDAVTGSDPAAIFQSNLALIDKADAVVANLNPFRGPEPDSGTAFEVGYAHARGKPILGYIDQFESTVDRVERLQGHLTRYGNEITDRDGYRVEDFGLPLNIMLAVPIRLVAGGVEDCLNQLQQSVMSGA
ncbi:nucleoside 2-deoxyribosyltransferase [Acidithiobacillus albertensis]|uniref:nucleoside 2-deoxyribosyltransferase n=1 Tax=Acidithiobacillus albertensis TaxID=119978 RepID=UPI001C072782|nr:nucleoside 2-deoxyribosyltransferase [Acidithiobacillus albertensis]MBU2740753.1 nucleoside 2-deoxyribosyltransferase [Acidithiobacillus albertensis]